LLSGIQAVGRDILSYQDDLFYALRDEFPSLFNEVLLETASQGPSYPRNGTKGTGVPATLRYLEISIKRIFGKNATRGLRPLGFEDKPFPVFQQEFRVSEGLDSHKDLRLWEGGEDLRAKTGDKAAHYRKPLLRPFSFGKLEHGLNRFPHRRSNKGTSVYD